jgi:hypothetical protein
MERSAKRSLQKFDHWVQFAHNQVWGDGVKAGAGWFADHRSFLSIEVTTEQDIGVG